MNYKEKLKDARWLIRKKEILIRDKYTCKLCGSHGKDGAELHVHHLDYIRDREPWEYNDLHLVTLCDKCHNAVHTQNVRLLLRKSAISNDFICEEDTDWQAMKSAKYL